MAHVLVTGANGFIGTHLVRELISRGHRVRALILPGTPDAELKALGAEVFQADLTDPSTIPPALKGIETVYHLAALARDFGPETDFVRVNTEGTRTLLEAAIIAGSSRLVFMSSLAVHDFEPTLAGNESTPHGTRGNAYARSKIAGEGLLTEAHRKRLLEGTIVRPGFFPFGPGDRTSFLKLAQALRKGRMAILDGGQAAIGTAYVENLVQGVALAGEAATAAGETFVIADDAAPTWRELLSHFAKALDAPPPRLSLPSRPLVAMATAWEGLTRAARFTGDPFLTLYRIRVASTPLVFSNAKAKAVLGFQPRIGLAEAIRRTAEWARRELDKT